MTACGGGGSSTGTTAAEQAHKALQSYIQNPAAAAPTREIYIEAGATPSDMQGVDIAMFNAYVRTLSSEDVDAAQEVELLVAAYRNNHPPQAYAGEDKRIKQGVSQQLHCQGSDTDGNKTLSYAWYRDSRLLSSTASYTVPATLTPGAYVYTCKVTDDYLRLATDDVTISVHDTTKPVITLLGNAEVRLFVGDSYTDAGATATDDTDGNISENIVVYNPVDITKIGTYVISYNVSDSRGNKAQEVHRIVRVSGRNLLEGKNPNVNTLDGYTNLGNHTLSVDSHTNDGSGSIKLVGHWYTKAIKTPTFDLEKGKKYTISAYMKAVGDQKGQNVMFKISAYGNGYPVEMSWNISKAEEWEEVAFPYIAQKSGKHIITIFTYRYAFSTDHNLAKEDGTNLDRNATVYLDDFRVVESEGVDVREPYTEKNAYESSDIRIDALGNWSVKENGAWKDIFPKFTYRDSYGDIGESVQKFKEYGFTGVSDIASMKELKTALQGGLKYNAIQINHLHLNPSHPAVLKDKQDFINEMKLAIKNGEINSTSVLMYNYDNEGVYLSNYDWKKYASDWISEHDYDNNTHSRARPIYMLNGVAEGVARNYSDLIDVTGTYVYQGGDDKNEEYKNPVDTRSILELAQNQTTPASVIQLQCYYHNLFVPAIFKGIISGAKALNFWRGGTDYLRCKKDFRENVWAPAIKGRNGVFAKIDKMLPLIKEPLFTSWSATVDMLEIVAIGTRENNGKHYLILSNFDKEDQVVHITINAPFEVGIVKDYFTYKTVATVEDNGFDIEIGHYNNGYLVLWLDESIN